MTFGKKLQSLRKEKGLSQDVLANQLYVTRQSVSQWENDRTMPSVDLLIKISGIEVYAKVKKHGSRGFRIGFTTNPKGFSELIS